MQTKFRNATGQLTAYALGCGYKETKIDGPVNVELYHEHGVYHIRGFDAETGHRLFWESSNNLAQARAFFQHGRALAVAA